MFYWERERERENFRGMISKIVVVAPTGVYLHNLKLKTKYYSVQGRIFTSKSNVYNQLKVFYIMFLHEVSVCVLDELTYSTHSHIHRYRSDQISLEFISNRNYSLLIAVSKFLLEHWLDYRLMLLAANMAKKLNPYYNLLYNPSAPFIRSGFLVSYRICSAKKFPQNVLHYILHTSRVYVIHIKSLSRYFQLTQDWTDKAKWRFIW